MRSSGLMKLSRASSGSSHSLSFTSGRSAAIAFIVCRSASRATSAETPSRSRPYIADAAGRPIPQKRALRIEILALPDGNEDVGHVELETGNRRRRDADDPHGFAIDVRGGAHEIRRSAKPVVPEAVAEHD